MKREENDFLEGITDNFSKLFVETFLMRYLNKFDKKNLSNSVEIAKTKLIKKVDEVFKTKI